MRFPALQDLVVEGAEEADRTLEMETAELADSTAAAGEVAVTATLEEIQPEPGPTGLSYSSMIRPRPSPRYC